MKKGFFILMMVLLSAMLIISCDDSKDDLGKKRYKAGDTGPGGGIIFYVNPNAKADKWTYLEVGKSDISPQDQYKFKWGPTIEECGTGEKIGDGLNNTKKLAAKGSSHEAASAVYGKDLYGNKCKDWFIPSRDEIKLLYESIKSGILNPESFSPDYYWTSSEEGDSGAWKINLQSGKSFEELRTNECRIRPVRRF